MIASQSTILAKNILADKSTGPLGVLPYIVANKTRTEVHTSSNGHQFEVNIPYLDPQSSNPTEIYYGMVRTNRVGIEVAVPPGGAQDILFTIDNQPHSLELGKPKQQKQLLQDQFNITAHDTIGQDELDRLSVSTLLDSPTVKNVRLESALDAAIHETQEEHGWNLASQKDNVLRIDRFTEQIFVKRSFQSEPPRPIEISIFAAAITDLPNFQASREDKIENKIVGREGKSFYEQGDWLSLRQLKQQLTDAQQQVQNNPALPGIVNLEIKATQNCIAVIEQIEHTLIQTLADEHEINVDIQPPAQNSAARPVCRILEF